jgi:hypothetical protein
MTSKVKTAAWTSILIVTLSMSAFAGKKSSSNHIAVGTIASISSDELVVNEKVKGKDQPVTFKLQPSTQKSGDLQNGSLVTVQYHNENSQKVASSVRERHDDTIAKKPSAKAK